MGLSKDMWQPIETAPKDGSYVLVYPPTWGRVTSCARWDDNRNARKPKPYWARVDDQGSVTRSRDNPPTHWMPLPEAPE